MLSIAGALLLAVVAFVFYAEHRGGRYPVYRASSFSNLGVPTASTVSSSEPVVQIASGLLRGAQIESSIAFRGVPYARPPVGELRWQPPQPPLPWQGVREALQPGSACTQRPSGLAPFIAPDVYKRQEQFAGGAMQLLRDHRHGESLGLGHQQLENVQALLESRSAIADEGRVGGAG